MVLSMVALHKRLDLVDACIALLNSEWSRSQSARLHSLEKSCEGLPYSLVMIETSNSQEKVAGYCRLAKVINQLQAVFIESVVVPTDRRGLGLGRRLMALAEEHSRLLGYTQIYLTTKDKQGFYEHLGYQFCKPVNTLNAQVLETCSCQLLTNLTTSEFTENISASADECVKGEKTKPDGLDDANIDRLSQLNVNISSETNTCDSNKETACAKNGLSDISCKNSTFDQPNQSCITTPSVTLPLPRPPPPPPPPPVVMPTITVFWMMKHLYDKQ